ncbi:uncharacterized protein LOC132904133 [Amyelois transitella]|uniref:uncharacterized protein LOC132904133 n=1 Tax=Amyelois transitella TaxID=680683 RepID=UPI0029903E70|nr:uncharacterized protein LOC132904133 [Amyelois transitella]
MQSKVTAMIQEQDSKLSKIIDAMSEIKQQNEDIRQAVSFMSEKYDMLLAKTQTLEEENIAYRKRVHELKEKMDGMERSAHSTRIELRNIPKKGQETKDDLIKILAKAEDVLGTPINRSDVKDIFRINTKREGNKPIIADLTSCITKEKIITGVKHHNKQNKENKLNTKGLSLDGPIQPVFISENLPQKSRQLYAAARDFAKKNNFKYCWTSMGRIYFDKMTRQNLYY